MKFYKVDSGAKQAVLLTDCIKSVADQIGDELENAVGVGNLWAIEDENLTELEDIEAVSKVRDMGSTYELVVRLGSEYIPGGDEPLF